MSSTLFSHSQVTIVSSKQVAVGNLGLIQVFSKVSVLAAQVDSTNVVYFVPVFSGNQFNPDK